MKKFIFGFLFLGTFLLIPSISLAQITSLKVDVKANGQDSGVSVPAFSNVSITWTSSGMTVCNISAPDASSRVPNSGSLTMTVPSRIGYTNNWPYTIYCLDSSGQRFSDTVVVSATPASVVAKPAPIPFIATMASGSDCQAVNVSWGSYDLNTASSFNIYRDGTKVGSVNANVYNYQDTGLVVGKTYKYTVRAVGTNGESLDSNTTSSVPSGSCTSTTPVIPPVNTTPPPSYSAPYTPSSPTTTPTYSTPIIPNTTTTKPVTNVLPVGCASTAGLSSVTGIACSSAGASTYYTSSNPTITVAGSAPINIIASPSSLSAGQASTISWSSTGFTSCSSIDFYVPRGNSTSGSAMVYPSKTTTFWIECTKSSGVEQKSVTITVSGTGGAPYSGYVPPTTTPPLTTTPPTTSTPTVVPATYCAGNVLPTISNPPGSVPAGWDAVYSRTIDLMATMQNNMTTNAVLAAQYNLLSVMLAAQGGQNDYTPPANIAPFHTWVNKVYQAASAWVGARAVTGPNGQGIVQTSTTGPSLSQVLSNVGINSLPQCPKVTATPNPVSVACSSLSVGTPDVVAPVPGYPWGAMYYSGNPKWREIEWRIQNGVALLPTDLATYYTEYLSAMGLSSRLSAYLRSDGTPMAGPGGIPVPQGAQISLPSFFPTFKLSDGVFDYQQNTGFIGSTSGAGTMTWFSPFSSSDRVVCPLSASTNNPNPTPAPINAKFSVGDNVITTASLNVRSKPSLSAPLASSPQPIGTRGIVRQGPVSADGYNWWIFSFLNGAQSSQAWSVENYVEKSNSTNTPTTPLAPPTNFKANTSNVCGGRIDVSWDVLPGVNYVLSGQGVYGAATSGTTIGSYQAYGLIPSANYRYSIFASDGITNSATIFSNNVSASSTCSPSQQGSIDLKVGRGAPPISSNIENTPDESSWNDSSSSSPYVLNGSDWLFLKWNSVNAVTCKWEPPFDGSTSRTMSMPIAVNSTFTTPYLKFAPGDIHYPSSAGTAYTITCEGPNVTGTMPPTFSDTVIVKSK